MDKFKRGWTPGDRQKCDSPQTIAAHNRFFSEHAGFLGLEVELMPLPKQIYDNALRRVEPEDKDE